MMKMEKWETKMDNMDLKEMLDEIDRALMENLAAEIGFPSYKKLENSSECIFDEYHITYLSDGRWVWWNPQKYKSEDPVYFDDKEAIIGFISNFLQLDDQQVYQLKKGLSEVPQMRKCFYCEHEFDPTQIDYLNGEVDDHQKRYCSTECAMEAIMGDIKDDF